MHVIRYSNLLRLKLSSSVVQWSTTRSTGSVTSVKPPAPPSVTYSHAMLQDGSSHNLLVNKENINFGRFTKLILFFSNM